MEAMMKPAWPMMEYSGNLPLGVVFRPLPNVAIKLDGSYHIQEYNGKKVSYPELRLDFSFAFSNLSA
jgi:hypothetical protein